MGLTVGGDPFGPSRTGRFDFPAPAEVVYTGPSGAEFEASSPGE
ncbi:hypothetical protein [Iamia sp.]|jgi:hypothetical protein|nr:hypothetical protein [Iamia sp.]HXH56835.1 hypothetical protein [Iamia sp.]